MSQQFVPLVTKYSMDSENPLQEIMLDISKMPRFRLSIIIDQNHKYVITKIFGHCISKIPVKIRVYRATKLLENIMPEKNDSAVLACYDTLKLFFEKDDDIKIHLSKIAKEEMCKTGHRIFIKGIIEEIARLT